MKENHGGIYSYMILSETLWKHLAEIDEECNEMMDRLAGQMAKKEGVTEQLKSDDWLCWIQKMNSIRSRAAAIFISSGTACAAFALAFATAPFKAMRLSELVYSSGKSAEIYIFSEVSSIS